MSVFIIINEWTNFTGTTSSEVNNMRFFTTEDEAQEALQVIAMGYGVVIEDDATSVSFEEPSPHIDYEEFYIVELTQG